MCELTFKQMNYCREAIGERWGGGLAGIFMHNYQNLIMKLTGPGMYSIPVVKF